MLPIRHRAIRSCCRVHGWVCVRVLHRGLLVEVAAKLQAAFSWAGRADLVVSVGSTLEVEPAASVPLSAKDNGASYVVINQGPTAHDQLADLRIEDDVNGFLPATVNHLRALIEV